ncbi:MAG TPA: ADOP family duplicated permease [Bryobacteraceae bacterium]|nr:ADOP family duplicated permease [Bryobacteraceae bacterium]
MSWLTRIRNVFAEKRLDDDLSEETRDHLQRRAEQLERQGLSQSKARQEAALMFGNAAVFREESREARTSGFLYETWRDVRYGLRGWIRNPVLTAAGVVSLSLAMGANTAVFALVNALFLRPVPTANPRGLVAFGIRGEPDRGPGESQHDLFSYPLYERLRTAAGDIARISLFSPPNRVEAQVDGPDSSYEDAIQQFVSPDAFEMLGIPPASGRLFSDAEDRYSSPRPAVALSYSYWQRRFGADPSAIGRPIVLDGRTYRILGVARRGFTGVEPGSFVDVWLPVTVADPAIFTNSNARMFQLMGRLSPRQDSATLAARLQPAFHRERMERASENNDLPGVLRNQTANELLAISSGERGISTFGQAYSRPLLLLGIVSLAILLIACANLAGLLLARAMARSGEMALRVSLGASRARLMRQVFTENLLILLAAGVVGWIASRIAAPLLATMVSTHSNPVSLDFTIDFRLIIFPALTGGLAAAIAGLMPAWFGTHQGPASSLRDAGRATGSVRIGRVLVAIQVAFAFSLVMPGIAFLYSLRNLTNLDPGFNSSRATVLTIVGNERDRTRQMELLRQTQSKVASLSGVQSAAAAWMPVLSGARRAQRVLTPRRQKTSSEVTFYRVSPGYFATLETPLLAGRDLTLHDNDDEPVPTVVNRAFASTYFGTDSVLGKEFRRDDGALHLIVGLAANSHFVDMRTGPEPIAYMPMKPTRAFTLYVRSTMDSNTVARTVERELKALGGGLRVRDEVALGAIVENTMLKERLLAILGGSYAVLGLALAAVGIFGALNYSVTRRTSEIGVRGALGAGQFAIYRLVGADIATALGLGLLAGLASALVLMRVARTLLFQVGPADPLVAGAALAILAGVAAIAGGVPAWRAANIDPVSALRHD